MGERAFALGEWESLQSTPENALPLPDLETAVQEVWAEFKNACDLNSLVLNVHYDGVKFAKPNYLNTLATASRTMWLIGDTWVPAALLPEHLRYLGGSIDIKINPYVPNGWYLDNGQCNVGNHFDLKTVLRHEFLHGVGLSSSLRFENGQEVVGFLSTGGTCAPFLMDTRMKTFDNFDVVDGCAVSPNVTINDDIFLNSVEIYNPDVYDPGSSYHHAADSNTLMYYGIPARKCLYLDDIEKKMLNGIGAYCPGDFTPVVNSSSDSGRSGGDFSVFILLIVLIKCLMVALHY